MYRNGEAWYDLRSVLQQMMLRPKPVSYSLPKVNQVTDEFIEKLHSARDSSKGNVFNIEDEIVRWTFEGTSNYMEPY